jgi:transposase
MLTLSPHLRYFVYNGATDMRKSFDGLTGLVRNELEKKSVGDGVFIFFNRNKTHVKILVWERDGFALYYKRLERGTFELPVSHNNEINAQTLSLILQGIVLSSVKKKKRWENAA